MIEGVIFDYGGTIDSRGVHWSWVIWDGYQKAGVNVSLEMLVFPNGDIGMDLSASLKSVASNSVSESGLTQISQISRVFLCLTTISTTCS